MNSQVALQVILDYEVNFEAEKIDEFISADDSAFDY